MDSKSLKPWQVNKLSAEIARSLTYLHRLRTRMEQRGFPAEDKLLKAVLEAQQASSNVQRCPYELVHGPFEPWDEAAFQKYLNSKPPDKRRVRRDERH